LSHGYCPKKLRLTRSKPSLEENGVLIMNRWIDSEKKEAPKEFNELYTYLARSMLAQTLCKCDFVSLDSFLTSINTVLQTWMISSFSLPCCAFLMIPSQVKQIISFTAIWFSIGVCFATNLKIQRVINRHHRLDLEFILLQRYRGWLIPNVDSLRAIISQILWCKLYRID
jgi:hypothetical protein